MDTHPTTHDPVAGLNGLLSLAEGLVLHIKAELSLATGADFRVPGETDDHTLYRNQPAMPSKWAPGPLSQLGEQVMLDLLKLGLSDAAVGLRMSVSEHGVAVRRRRWGRAYCQKG